MAEIAARDKGSASPGLLNRLAHAVPEAHVSFIGEEVVAERNDLAAPAVASQKVKRHRRAVIQIKASDPHHQQMLIGGGAGNLVKQRVVEFGVDGGGRRPKVGKIAV